MITSVLTAGSPFAAVSAYAGGKGTSVLTAGQEDIQSTTTVLSAQAVQANTSSQTDNSTGEDKNNTTGNSDTTATNALTTESEAESESALNSSELTPTEEGEVRELKKRDAEVKAHEQAHSTVGGPYAGSPQYAYTSGPDGKRYAVSGEVPIDASPIRDNPEATIRKMDVVIRAALAPADPSPQDQQVAAQARQTRLQAQNQLQAQNNEKLLSGGEESDGSSPSPAAVANAVQAYQQNSIDPARASGDLNQAERFSITV